MIPLFLLRGLLFGLQSRVCGSSCRSRSWGPRQWGSGCFSHMASSSAVSTAFNSLQIRAVAVSSMSRVCGSSCRSRSWGPRQWGTMRRNFFVSKCSSSSPSDFSAGDEISGKNGNVGVVVTFPASKEVRENVFLRNALVRFEEATSSFPPVMSVMNGIGGERIAVGVFLALTTLLIIVRKILARKPRHNHHGSVADLVRRGQLKSHKRGISVPLKYEDPFNNPLVKVNQSKSSVEMCGKVYSLVPLTLTAEQRSIHQRRRSRAYEWKRPTVFLKEGDPLPAGVDPDTVRWIPANHPFATTTFDLDEDIARNNVHLQSGVPYRVRVEHEALQKKIDAQTARQTNQRQNLSEEWNPSEEPESRQSVDQRYPSQNADLASDSSK